MVGKWNGGEEEKRRRGIEVQMREEKMKGRKG